jgi:cation:H+ antiporter
VTALLFVVTGLVLLAVGGELLVRGATRLASIAGLTPAVIGLTVVAIGTSLPELVVSVAAAANARADLAIANVLGSNIVNITGTLGLVALIYPVATRMTVVRLEWPVLLVATAAGLVAMRDGLIDRFEAGFFLISLVTFIAYSIHLARREASAAEKSALAEQAESHSVSKSHGIPYSLVFVALGLTMLIAGGDVMVKGAVGLARSFGVSERIIGLTIVAIGTGAPEIATTVIAAVRKQADLAMGNLIGSNIFNLLGILGTAALWRPLQFDGTLVGVDGWWMLAAVVLLLPIMLIAKRVTRIEGAILVLVYAVYLVTVMRTA